MAHHSKSKKRFVFNIKDAVKTNTFDIDLYTKDSCITEKTCLYISQLIDKYSIPSSSRSVKLNTDIARSMYMVCELNEARIPGYNKLVDYISSVLSVDSRLLEPLDGIKFSRGDYHGRHVDFVEEQVASGAASIKKYGQRMASFIIYLNDNFKGGETCFPTIGKKIEPLTGRMVIWGNLDKNYRPNYFAMREEAFVKTGVKYILLGHVREQRVARSVLKH